MSCTDLHPFCSFLHITGYIPGILLPVTTCAILIVICYIFIWLFNMFSGQCIIQRTVLWTNCVNCSSWYCDVIQYLTSPQLAVSNDRTQLKLYVNEINFLYKFCISYYWLLGCACMVECVCVCVCVCAHTCACLWFYSCVAFIQMLALVRLLQEVVFGTQWVKVFSWTRVMFQSISLAYFMALQDGQWQICYGP